MFDTLAVARSLTAAGMEPSHADALTNAVRSAAEHGEHVTPDMLDAKLAAALAALEARLAWRLITAGIAIAGIAVAATVALVIAAIRLLE